VRYGPLMKRLDRLTPKPVRPDNDDDGFLTAVGALPGESAMEALERQAAMVWADYEAEL